MNNAYINLVGAIIAQAIGDLGLRPTTAINRQNRKSAEEFIRGEGLEYYCGLCGLDADYIRRQIEKNSKKIELLTDAVQENA